MDVSEIFGNNIIIIYFFICLGLFVHSEMTENQKMTVLYMCSYAACLLRVIPVIPMAITVVLIQFIYAEYLTEDIMKLKVMTQLKVKILDYLFQFLFNYATWGFLIALVLVSYRVEKLAGKYYLVVWGVSGLIIFGLIQYIISKKFRAKSISQIMRIFEKYPIYDLPIDIEDCKFEILPDMEDKSFFARENTYNVISIEFLKYKFRGVRKSNLKKLKLKNILKIIWKYIKQTKNIRGYSTIEMQLIRTIGLEHGYTCTIRRKIFEFVYTKIFMTSLKMYYKEHQSANWRNFKRYLIWIYYNTVPVRINGKDYKRFADVFECPIEDWTMEQMFIAILALSGKEVNEWTLDIYDWVIKKYNLNIELIFLLSDQGNTRSYNSFEFSLFLPETESVGEVELSDIQDLFAKEIEEGWQAEFELIHNEIQVKMYGRDYIPVSVLSYRVKKILDKDKKRDWSMAFG